MISVFRVQGLLGQLVFVFFRGDWMEHVTKDWKPLPCSQIYSTEYNMHFVEQSDLFLVGIAVV